EAWLAVARTETPFQSSSYENRSVNATPALRAAARNAFLLPLSSTNHNSSDAASAGTLVGASGCATEPGVANSSDALNSADSKVVRGFIEATLRSGTVGDGYH